MAFFRILSENVKKRKWNSKEYQTTRTKLFPRRVYNVSSVFLRTSNFGAEPEHSFMFCDMRLKTFLRCSKIYMIYFVSPGDFDNVEVILKQI